jgi:hypothetical protein
MSKDFKHIIEDYITTDEQYDENKLARRPTISYPDEVNQFIELLTVDKKDHVDIFGSYIYKQQLYASDIDIYEEHNSKKDIQSTANSFFPPFKRMVKRVLDTPLIYYSETKCGIDTRYDLSVGSCIEGVYQPHTSLATQIDALYNRSLLDKEDHDILSKTIRKSSLNGDDYDVVNYILRKYYILRWSANEIFQGYKVLRGGQKFKFTDGLQQDTLVKIDIWAYVNNKLLEITNVYLLSFTKGKKLYNIQSHNKITGLLEQIERFYYSNMWYNPFKMVKRIYSFLRQSKERGINFDPSLSTLLEKISNVVSGGVSSLYQNKSEIDTTILLLEKYGVRALTDDLYIATDKIKSRLASLLFITDDVLLKWCENIDMVNSGIEIHTKIEILEDISREMKYIIDSEIIILLNLDVLNPPNRILLPHVLTYDPSIVRRPDSYVINPLTKIVVKGGYSLTDDDITRIAISKQRMF